MYRFRSRLPRYGGVALGMAGAALAAWLGAALTGSGATAIMAADPPPTDESKPATDDKPLRFSDEDLEKFRKPAPVSPEGESPAPARDTPAPKPAPVPTAGKGAPAARPAPPAATAPAPRSAAGATPGTTAPPAASPRPAAAAAPVSRMSAPARPPAPDPLKKWKDREQLETFREDQLRTLRARISSLESRLEYLNLKRLSIQDPTRIMPMPQTEEDRSADRGKGARDLLAAVEKEIEAAEADLTQAKADLITIETRFAQESGRP